jgi:hypothetical protein
MLPSSPAWHGLRGFNKFGCKLHTPSRHPPHRPPQYAGAHVDQIPQYDSAAGMAVRFLLTFTMQVEALAKPQRGGEQVVTVVHVHPGAQAIVGNVVSGASGAPHGGGGTFENENQPHAKGELPAPSATPIPQVWSEDELLK